MGLTGEVLNAVQVVPRGTALGFATSGAVFFVAEPRGEEHVLVAFDARDRSRRELHRASRPILAALARDLRRVVVLTEAELIVIDEAEPRSIACPFGRALSAAGLGPAALSPASGFVAVGGWMDAGASDPRWQIAFVDLDRGGIWVPDDPRVGAPSRWLGEVAVVSTDLVCDPARRAIEARGGIDTSPRSSPSGARSFERDASGLLVRGPDGASRLYPLSLDSFDELAWIDDRWLVHRSAPHVLVDAEGELVALALADEAHLSIAPSLRHAGWERGGAVFIGDLAVLPVPACPVVLDELPSSSAEPSARAEALALEVARRALPWGLELVPRVRWERGTPDDAELARPWAEPIERGLTQAHRGRDGHRAVFEPLAPVVAALVRADPPGPQIARLALADADWRSAVAFDLLVPSGPLRRTPFAALDNPFEPALRLCALGCLVLDVGASGIRVLAPR